MKRFITGFGTLLLFGLSGFTANAAEAVTIAADESYPPYMYRDGKPKGLYVDIMQEVAKRVLDYVITIEPLPWKRALAELENGGFPAVLGAYRREAERPWIEHYSVPLHTERVVAFCQTKKIRPNMKFPDDFTGLTFANNTGFLAAGAPFFKMVADGKITVEEGHSTENNVRKLAAGHVDCYVNDEITILQALKAIGSPASVAVAATASLETAHLTFGSAFKAPWKADFEKKVDVALQQMTEDGSIRKIVDQYTK